MKKILLILGHSDKSGMCGSLADAYERGAQKTGFEFRRINLGELDFDPILWKGYREIQELEVDLVKAQEDIKWADHLVFIFPNWWASFPAILKGFFDRIFLPGFGYKFNDNSLFWEKLLVGKTARLVVTMDSFVWYYRIFLLSPGVRSIQKGILEFCGIKPARTVFVSSLKNKSEKQKNGLRKKVEELGKRGK